MIELKIKPQLPGIIKGRNNELYALVKATGTGDQQNIGESPPLNLEPNCMTHAATYSGLLSTSR